MRFFSSRAHEFPDQKNSAKAKTHHSGKFAPRRNNPLYGILYVAISYASYFTVISFKIEKPDNNLETQFVHYGAEIKVHANI